MSSPRSPSKHRKSSKSKRSSSREKRKKESKLSNAARSDALRKTFLRRIYDPSIVPRLEKDYSEQPIEEDAPWVLKVESIGNGAKPASSAENGDQVCFPPWSYLELRQKQHEQWATVQLEQGVRLAKEGKADEAEKRYKEGLNLAPTHAPLLVAYGALCANAGRTKEAVAKLNEALAIDPECPNAQKYLDEIQNPKPLAPPRQAASLLRSETAMKDVLAEKAFLSGEAMEVMAENGDIEYPLVYEETPVLEKDDEELDKQEAASMSGADSSRSYRKHHRRGRARDKHRKSHSKRKRRHRTRSESPYGEDSDSEEERRKKRHKKKHKRRKKHRRRSRHSDSQYDGSDSDNSHSRRKKHRQKHHRKKSRRHRDDDDGSSRSVSPPAQHNFPSLTNASQEDGPTAIHQNEKVT